MTPWKDAFLAIDTEAAGMPKPNIVPRIFAFAAVLFERQIECTKNVQLFSPGEDRVHRAILEANRDLIPPMAREGRLDRLPTFRGRVTFVQDQLLSARVWMGHHLPYNLDVLRQEFKLASRDLDRFMKANDILAVDTRALAAWLLRPKREPSLSEALDNIQQGRPARPDIGLNACSKHWMPEAAPLSSTAAAEAVLVDARRSGALLLAMMKDLPDDREEMRRLQDQATTYMQKKYPVKSRAS